MMHMLEDERNYFDADGNEVSLDKLVRIEPAWAANRIRWMTAENERLKAALSDICGYLERWRKQLEEKR